MLRLVAFLFTFALGWALDTDPGGGDPPADPPATDPEKHTLTEEELTSRTSAAAEAERKRVAEILGVDPEKFEDAKALIEAGKKAAAGASQQPPAQEKPDEEKTDIEKFQEVIDDLSKKVESFESKQTEREQAAEQHAAQQARNEKLTAALKEAGASDEKMADVARYAGTFDLKVNDKGELEGSKDAVAAAKKAFPDAFRGEGDDGKAADASGQQKGQRRPKNLTEAVMVHYQKK